LTRLQASHYHRGVQTIVSSAQMRQIDRITSERGGPSSLELMENAALAIARAVTALGVVAGKSILVLCGPGNNGGDGAAAARLLAGAGAQVDIVLLGQVDGTKGDAKTNFERIRNSKEAGAVRFFECTSTAGWLRLKQDELADAYDLVVDALLGTGLTRPLEGTFSAAVAYLLEPRRAGNNQSPVRPVIISIDIPSGLNADSAQPPGPAVRADFTVTMTAAKAANVLAPACDYNGQLIVADIGSPKEIIDEAETLLFLSDESDARRWLTSTRYVAGSFKNTHGHVLVIAGSRGFTGAAALCGNAAMRSGAGLITVATPASAQPLVAVQVMPEVMTAALAETDRGAVSDDALSHILKLTERANVIAIGPGLSAEDERTRNFVRTVLEKRTTPVVVDADALNCLAPWPSDLHGTSEFPIVLTPHPGEMLRLLGTDDKSLLDDRVTAARNFSVTHQVIVVLKGDRALIANPDGRVFVNSTGNPGLGTAGAGDTLTGVIAGFLAQAYGTLKRGAVALDSVIAALYVSGLAGDLAAEKTGMRTMVASDIREHLGAAICALDPDGERPLRDRH
jgi:NAD(P)H-hydrate epimerase